MAGDTERLFVQLEARISDFEKKMARAEKRGTKTYTGLSRNSRRTTRQMEQDMLRSTTAINRRLQTMQRTAAGVGRTLAGGLGIGIATLSIAELSRTIGDVVKQADGIGKAADRIGLSTSALQELRYAAGLAGVSTGALEMSMQRFSRRIGEAANGTGQLKDVLEANGLELRDSEGNMRPLTDLLEDYADLIKNAGSEQEQLTLAVKAFDSEGATMVNLLRDGSRALRETRKEANDLGGVLEEDLVRSAEEVNDRFTRLATTIGTSLKRAILEVVDAFDALTRASAAPVGRDLVTDMIDGLETRRASLEREVGTLRTLGQDAEASALEAQLDQIDARIAGLRSQASQMAGGISYGPQTRGGIRRAPAETETIVPGGTDSDTESRTRNASAMVAQTNAARALIEELRFENSLIGKTAEEVEVLTAQRSAGKDATDQQRDTIAQLITLRQQEEAAILAQTEAHEANQQAMRYLTENALDGLFDIASGAKSAEEAVKELASAIAKAALQAALFGDGPLGGLLGGPSGQGLLGAILKSPLQLSSGGHVRGPGTSTSDSIPAMLSDGEYVVNADAVKQPGMLEMLTAINAGKVPGYARGGLIGPNAEGRSEKVWG
ncbi:MAG: hypothetical protein AAGH60_02090 [Pseudomonadota bacterium]